MARTLGQAVQDTLTAMRSARNTRISNEQTAISNTRALEATAVTSIKVKLGADYNVDLSTVTIRVAYDSGNDNYRIVRFISAGGRDGDGRYIRMNGTFSLDGSNNATLDALGSGKRWTAFYDSTLQRNFDDMLEALAFSLYGRQLLPL
ncbi:MAG: hypothetical protein KC443_25745 [Anaerolineales bacterium]|nr:hypothetical protein [Anaerolineales bacterium]